jgi:hypothetical protein
MYPMHTTEKIVAQYGNWAVIDTGNGWIAQNVRTGKAAGPWSTRRGAGEFAVDHARQEQGEANNAILSTYEQYY